MVSWLVAGISYRGGADSAYSWPTSSWSTCFKGFILKYQRIQNLSSIWHYIGTGLHGYTHRRIYWLRAPNEINTYSRNDMKDTNPKLINKQYLRYFLLIDYNVEDLVKPEDRDSFEVKMILPSLTQDPKNTPIIGTDILNNNTILREKV